MRLTLLILLSMCSGLLFGQLRFEYDGNLTPASSLPRDFTAFDGRLFFVADDGFNGRQIWCHDPADETTYQISDFSANHSVYEMGKLTVFQDKLIFSGLNDDSRKLWRLSAGATQPELMSIPDSLQTLNYLTATADHLYWTSNVDGRYYLVRLDGNDELLNVTALSAFPLILSILEDDIYVFLGRGEGIRRFSPTAGVLDTVARNTLGLRDINQISSTGISDGKLVSFTRVNNRWRLSIYDPVVDSLFINETAQLEGNNFLTPLVCLNDRIFVHQFVRDTGILVREYLPESDVFRRPAGLDQWQDRYDLFQELDGKLFLSDRLAPFLTLSLPLFYDTETNEVTEGPDLGSSLDHNSPQRFGEQQMTLINDNWYYAGADSGVNIEPYRYESATNQYGRFTDIHKGTMGALLQQIQPFVNDQILVSEFRKNYRYDPVSRVAIDLTDDIPGLEWDDFFSSVHPLPGHLVFGDVVYQDTFYRAIAYDSSQQLMVPILKHRVVCNGGSNNWTGPFVELDGDIWFSACQEDSMTTKTSLFRYTPGTSTPERVALDGRVTVGAPPGHKTIMVLNDRLFFVTNTSFFANQYLMMTYHPQEGVQQVNSPLEPSLLVQMNGADSVAYYLARAPNRRDITLAYQPNGRISALSVGNDSLRLLGTEAVATIPNDHRHYLLAEAGGVDEIGLFRYDPVVDTTGVIKILSPDIFGAHNLVHHLGKLYFSGDTRAFGTELHEFDLTTNEEQRIADIRPGPIDGGASHTISHKERLFFAAIDNFRGRELWSYQPGCFNLEVSPSPSNINRPTGAVTLAITDGLPPFQYSWSNGATTASLENVAAGFYEVTVTDARECSSSINTWVETDGIISSTVEPEVGLVKVYPNPFHDQLQLAFPAEYSTPTNYAVYALSGQQLLSGRVPGGAIAKLDLSSLPSGISVLVLTGEQGASTLVQKIVKR